MRDGGTQTPQRAFRHGLGGYTNKRCRCEVCSEAWSTYQRNYRARNPGNHAEIARSLYLERLAFAKDRLGNRCAKCGIGPGETRSARAADGLEFDHIDPSSKAGNITQMLRAPLRVLEAELAKCQLLCSSCHLEKTRREADERATHGTLARYRRGCRCPECKKAMSIKNRIYHARRKEREACLTA